MQKIMFVSNNDLSVVNEELRLGWKVKKIKTFNCSGKGLAIGSICAYVVLEMKDKTKSCGGDFNG